MAFLLGFSVADLDIQQRTPSEERQFPFAACRHAGQLGKLRPIGNRRLLACLQLLPNSRSWEN
jgi:hypothetical protein